MGGLVDSIFGGGDDAADAAIQSANISAKSQREALDYLKQREALPTAISDAALSQLGGLYGLQGFEDPGAQEGFISSVMASPLYGALMGGQEAGEEAILRSASATGGLRSGNVQEALYDYNTQLQNQALLSAYQDKLGGIQGLSGLGGSGTQIAQTMAGIGATQAQGVTAAAQAQQAAQQQQTSTLMGIGNLGIAAYGAGMFSDRRLKKNIKLIGNVKGWNWYRWDWNTVAQKMGLKGSCQGCMADEVFVERPDAVIMKDLFMFVLYPKLDIFGGAHG